MCVDACVCVWWIEESKFLGGDMDNTHRVKGLDYAFANKVSVWLCTWVCVHVGMYGCTRVCMDVHVGVWICTCKCVCT